MRLSQRDYARRIHIARLLLIALALLIAVYLAYQRGLADGEYADRIDAMKSPALQPYLSQCRAETDDLRQRVVILETGTEIDREAAATLRVELAAAQAATARLEREIELFKSITDPSIRTKGLALHSFELLPAEAEHAYRYRMIFLQRAQKHVELKGSATMRVSGTEGGKPRTLELAQIATDDSGAAPARLGLQFVYFQVLEGTITLPSGFAPAQVRVQAETGGARPQRVDRTLEWAIAES